MDIFQVLRELDLDIIDYMEFPYWMSPQARIMFLIANKAAKKAGLRRRH